MSDIKLFKKIDGTVEELPGQAPPLERALQNLFEKNLEAFLGVRFLASEFVTSNGGRMDTLGIDENGFPVIIEYKRDRSENIINQGLFYLDWLMDHRGDFELLVRDRFDKVTADAVEWSAPRLICIASDFTKYDEHAIKQMGKNIELIRYRGFGEDLLMLDLFTSVSTKAQPVAASSSGTPNKYKTNSQSLADAGEDLSNLYSDIEVFMVGLGDDVVHKTLKNYFAFKRIKNFACVEIKPQANVIRLYLKVDLEAVAMIERLEDGFTRDVRNIGHFGTGNLEVTVKNHEDFERAKSLIHQSYEAS